MTLVGLLRLKAIYDKRETTTMKMILYVQDENGHHLLENRQTDRQAHYDSTVTVILTQYSHQNWPVTRVPLAQILSRYLPLQSPR